ncbi:MAG: hypothetical protein RLZZ142_255, partial [Verrucomicrobiota bacterium]
GESNFGVVVGEGDVAKVLLWEGDGMLKSAGAGEWKRMEKGMALRVERGVAFADVGGAEEFFTTPRVLEERLAQGMTRRLEWWRASLRQAPPEDVLVHYAFEEMAGRELGNRGWVGGEAARGWIVGSPWVEGRWPGKGALDFKRVSDRVRIRVPGEWDAITWMAWVRVDSLPNALHGLVLDGAAHLHWQITGAGELQLGAAHGKGRERGVSPPVITPERFGQWLHLASSFDGRNGRICHYFNGERVSEHRVTPGVKLRLSEADIGNWTPEASRGGHAVRNLNGRMDELLLVRRALDPEEVRRHFQSGDPAYLPPVTGAIR